jgi:hypothetical protein
MKTNKASFGRKQKSNNTNTSDSLKKNYKNNIQQLQYPPKNIVAWTEEVITAITSQYGKLVSILTDFEVPVKAIPSNDEFISADEVQRTILLTQIQAAVKYSSTTEDKIAEIYGLLLEWISPQSRIVIEKYSWTEIESGTNLEYEVDWSFLQRSKNAGLLWKAIQATHLIHLTGVAEIDSLEALTALLNCKQESNETIASYSNRVKAYTTALETTTFPKLNDPIYAAIFMRNLDNRRYQDFKSKHVNYAIEDVRKYPASVAEAYKLAANSVATVSTKPSTSSVSDNIFVTIDDSKSKSKPNNNNNNNSNKAKKSKKKGKGDDKCKSCGKPGCRPWDTNCPKYDPNYSNKKPKDDNEATVNYAFCGHITGFISDTPIITPTSLFDEVHISANEPEMPPLVDFIESDSDDEEPPPLIDDDSDVEEPPPLIEDDSDDEDDTAVDSNINHATPGNETSIISDEVFDIGYADDIVTIRYPRSIHTTSLTNSITHVNTIPTDSCDEANLSPSTVLALQNKEVKYIHVLLDSGATISIFCNKEYFIPDTIHRNNKPLVINGFGGGKLTTNLKGQTPWGSAYYAPEAEVNILSLGDVHNKDHILELTDRGYILSNADGSNRVEFEKTRVNSGYLYLFQDKSLYPKDKFGLHTTSNLDVATALADEETAEDRSKGFSQQEKERALEAKRLIQALGYPGLRDVYDAVTTSRIVDCPLTGQDIKNAIKIYSSDLQITMRKGKEKTSPPIKYNVEFNPPALEPRQNLYGDLFYIDGTPYLILVALPLYLTMVVQITAKTGAALETALNNLIGELKGKGYIPQKLIWDGEKGIDSIKTFMMNKHGVEVLINSPDNHIHIVERRIETLKERARCILASLPYVLPEKLMVNLVTYVVQKLNSMPVVTRPHGETPRELYKGTKLNYKTDLKFSFGDYVQVHNPATKNNPSNSVRNERTDGLIALHPTGAADNSWYFFDPYTGNADIRRTGGNKYAIPPAAIKLIEQFAGPIANKNRRDPTFLRGDQMLPVGDPILDYSHNNFDFSDGFRPINIAPSLINTDDIIDQSNNNPLTDPDEHDNGTAPVPDPIMSPTDPAQITVPFNTLTNSDSMIPDDNQVDVTQESTFSDEISEPIATNSVPEIPSGSERRSGRTRVPNKAIFNADFVNQVGTNMDIEHLNYVFAQLSVQKGIQEHGERAINAIKDELQQMLDKKVWHYASADEKRGVKTIHSTMFLKEKEAKNNNPPIIKARLAARGDMQDRSLYDIDQTSSPAVSLDSLLMVAAIACRHDYIVKTADVKGAYLNADMKSKVIMKLNKHLSSLMSNLDPTCVPFINDNGTLDVALDKALYGCIESGKLWYETISKHLHDLGYKQHPQDKCVFYKNTSKDGPIIICLYVDDLFITCPRSLESQVNKDLEYLNKKYGELTINSGNIHNYLGMTFDFSVPGKCKISMPNYINNLLTEFNITGSATSPAANHLFDINPNSSQLNNIDKKRFHTAVYKLLFLSKRARPDIILATNFLTTRVHLPDQDDQKKLTRLFNYLNSTRDIGIVLCPSNDMTPTAFVDASHAITQDCRGQGGIVISLGDGPVYVSSSRIPAVTKSSTESELVTAANLTSQLLWSRDFLIALGFDIGAARLYQDNQSTIRLINNGQSNSLRTKHISVKYFWLKDRIENGEITIEYCPTENMIADIMTKPLQGAAFIRMRDLLMNWFY